MGIGKRHCVTDTAIRTKIRQKGWVRNASEAKREMVGIHLVNVSCKSSEGSSVSELIRTSAITDIEVMKAIGELSAKHSRPITQRELAKQVRGLIDRPFDSLINWLVRNGEIGIEKHKPARGRETVRYFLVKDDENA
jgi:hypothetical protein